MKAIAAAVLVATLAGCAVVPLGPPVYVGITARGGDGGYRDGGYRANYGGNYRGGYGGGGDYGRGSWR